VARRPHTPLFTTATPYAKASPVTLFAETWTDHIIQRHPELIGQEGAVFQVAANPTIIFPGHSPNTAMFVNQAVTTAGGIPLGVIVDEEGKAIVTAYYNRSIEMIPESQALWLLQKK
jgi:hypothetical protein